MQMVLFGGDANHSISATHVNWPIDNPNVRAHFKASLATNRVRTLSNRHSVHCQRIVFHDADVWRCVIAVERVLLLDVLTDRAQLVEKVDFPRTKRMQERLLVMSRVCQRRAVGQIGVVIFDAVMSGNSGIARVTTIVCKVDRSRSQATSTTADSEKIDVEPTPEMSNLNTIKLLDRCMQLTHLFSLLVSIKDHL